MERDDRVILFVGPRPTRDGPALRTALSARGLRAVVARDARAGGAALLRTRPAVLVVDLSLRDGAGLALGDLAAYRHPGTPVIFLSDGTAFADGSVFASGANVGGLLPQGVATEDLVEVVAWRAGASRPPVAALADLPVPA